MNMGEYEVIINKWQYDRLSQKQKRASVCCCTPSEYAIVRCGLGITTASNVKMC